MHTHYLISEIDVYMNPVCYLSHANEFATEGFQKNMYVKTHLRIALQNIAS